MARKESKGDKLEYVVSYVAHAQSQRHLQCETTSYFHRAQPPQVHNYTDT